MTRWTLYKHVYQPSHGPKVWPWWRLATVHVARCSHDPAPYFWLTPITFNIWLYTRWGARCLNYSFRGGIYARDRYGGLSTNPTL